MANTFRDDPLTSGHRADEIGVHMRRTGVRRPGWLLPLLGALVLLAFLYWALSRRHSEPAAPAFTLQGQQTNSGLPDLPEPRMPEKPVLPDLPKAALPETPQGVLPGAPSGEPEKVGGAALAAPAGEAADAFPGCAEATFHFSIDDPGPSDAERARLDEVARCLKDNPSENVRLEGRAHPVAGRPDARTEALAMHRARTIGAELERLGVPASQLRPMSSAPLCTENDAACSTRNRTVTVNPAD